MPMNVTTENAANSTMGAELGERLRRAELKPTRRRLMVLEAAEALPPNGVTAMAILRFLYDRGTLIPLPSLYRILRDMKHRGVLEHLH